MPIRPYAPAGPSIHPTIYIRARGPFALCQAILIPIYHLFLAAPSFLSARSSSTRPSFLNPSTPIGFFRGLSFERLSSSLYPRPLLSSFLILSLLPETTSVVSLPLSPTLALPHRLSLLSTVRRYEREFVLPCRFVRTNALSYFWLPRGRRWRGDGPAEERRTMTVREWSCRNIGLAHSYMRRMRARARACSTRQREKSIVRIICFPFSLIL